jgi:hypothetical protein
LTSKKRKRVSKSEDPYASDDSDEVRVIGYAKNLRAFLLFKMNHKNIFEMRLQVEFKSRYDLSKKLRGRTDFYEIR